VRSDIIELKWIAEEQEICLFTNTLMDAIMQDGG